MAERTPETSPTSVELGVRPHPPRVHFQDGVNVLKRSRERGKRFVIFDKSVRDALRVEPTNTEIAEAVGLAPSRSEPALAFDGIPFLRHRPDNEMHPKLMGAANLKRLRDEILWRVRNHPDVPAAFVRKEVGLALQHPESSAPDVEAFVASMRKGMDL